MKRYVLCRACGHRNDRTGGRRKCASCASPLPKRKVARHAATLRDDSYAVYCKANEEIHGVADESCGVCGKPRSQERRHDRDHDHLTGKPRGLACGGNRGCNVLMLPWISAATAHGIAKAKRAAGEPDAERWRMIEAYLFRVERFYAAQPVAV
jgi:Recombination endonuclease VII